MVKGEDTARDGGKKVKKSNEGVRNNEVGKGKRVEGNKEVETGEEGQDGRDGKEVQGGKESKDDTEHHKDGEEGKVNDEESEPKQWNYEYKPIAWLKEDMRSVRTKEPEWCREGLYAYREGSLWYDDDYNLKVCYYGPKIKVVFATMKWWNWLKKIFKRICNKLFD